MIVLITTVFLASYLLGSIPFGLLLTKAAGLGDIRSMGSGNIGATNVLRTGNKKLAVLTLLLDGAKGAVAVLLVTYFDPELGQFAAIGSLIGHMFPIWLKFKGGKGVATGLGVMTALNWPTGIAMMLTWLATAGLFKVSSLSALVAAALSPLYLMAFGRTDLAFIAVIAASLIFHKHKDNIKRLANGTEPKIGK